MTVRCAHPDALTSHRYRTVQVGAAHTSQQCRGGSGPWEQEHGSAQAMVTYSDLTDTGDSSRQLPGLAPYLRQSSCIELMYPRRRKILARPAWRKRRGPLAVATVVAGSLARTELGESWRMSLGEENIVGEESGACAGPFSLSGDPSACIAVPTLVRMFLSSLRWRRASQTSLIAGRWDAT